MSEPKHEQLKELTGAYALGVLDESERRQFEAHLLTCEPCAAEVLSFQSVIEDLASSVPLTEPPASLRERVMSAIDGDKGRAGGARGLSAADQIERIAAAPDVRRIELAGRGSASHSQGHALWSPANGVIVTTPDLPPPLPGKAYQVWLVSDPAPISAGMLHGTDGRFEAVASIPLDGTKFRELVVTLEIAEGVQAPTGPVYLVGKL